MKIVVLAGGNSDEREVSLRSGQAVTNALRQAGHEVEFFDPAEQNVENLAGKFDLAFPVLHGKGGEDGTIQRRLNDISLAHVGSGAAASELCFDKWQYRNFVIGHDVVMAAAELVDAESIWQSSLATRPFVLKPSDGGSSIDTLIVRDIAKLQRDQIDDVFSRHTKLLLEKLIDGIEITVGVVGDRPLPVVEIIPPESGEFDYENKYNGASQELCPPQRVAETVQQAARELGLRLHQICGCSDYSRSDMIVAKDGSLTVLETNTLPGMTNQSLLPKAAAAAGMDMPALCQKLVESAVARYKIKSL